MVVGLGDTPHLAFEIQPGPFARHRPEQFIKLAERRDRVGVEGLSAQRIVGIAGIIEAERIEADAVVAQGGEQVARIDLSAAGFGDEQRIVGARIPIECRFVARRSGRIEVGRQDVDVGSGDLIYGEHVPARPARGIGARRLRVDRVLQSIVHIGRQRIDRLARRDDVVDVGGDRPGVEEFVGIGTKDLMPVAGRLQRFLAHTLDQGVGHRLVHQLVGQRRIVAHAAVDPDLVLRLDDDDRVLVAVDRLDVVQQGDIGLLVGLARRGVVRRQGVGGRAVLAGQAREALVVELDPARRIARTGILPGAEPQDVEADIVLTRLLDQRIDEAEIEMAFGRLDLFPRHRHDQSIGVHGLDRRPYLGQHGGIVARIVSLAGQHQIWRAVDHQGELAVLLHQLRHWRLGRSSLRRHGADGGERQAEGEGFFHDFSLKGWGSEKRGRD